MNRVVLEGRLVNHDYEFSGQVEVDTVSGLITRMSQNPFTTADYRFDSRHLIFPGFSDIHIHAREDSTQRQIYKEDYDTVTAAAINGGVVAVGDMCNQPDPLTTTERLAWHRRRCATLPVHHMHYVGVGQHTTPLDEYVPYKMFLGPSVGDLFFSSARDVHRANRRYAEKAVSYHVEDNATLDRHKGEATHRDRRPPACVEAGLGYLLQDIERFGIDAKLCHWSTGGKSFEMISAHRDRGFKTQLEVSPLHLYFDADMLRDCPERWPYLQMNPSLQSERDRLELIAALKSGFIDHLATDHAPHTLDEKFKQFHNDLGMSPEDYYLHLRRHDLQECRRRSVLDGTSGTPQLDTYALICAWLMEVHGFKPKDIARVAAFNPGSFVNRFHPGPGKFGRIDVGYYGSFTVINRAYGTSVSRDRLKTKCGWSPYEGHIFPGSVAMVMIKGKVYKEG